MIVHLITTECVNDGRVMRAAQTGKALGQAVVVLARSKSDVPLEETIGGVTIRRLKLGTARLPRRQPFQTVKFAELHRKLVSEAVDLRPAVVHAHDLSALPLGVAVAKRSRARLIYDSHELWSSIIGGKYGAAMAGMICALERRWAGRADAIVTVSDAIAHRLAQQFQVTLPMVVRNVPHAPDESASINRSPLRSTIGVGPDTPVMLYLGGLSPGRGLTTLLEATSRLHNQDAHLVLLGDGPMRGDLLARAGSDHDQGSRIHFLPAVPQKDVLTWASGATLGIHPMDGGSLNHELALPNKIFEYIHAGLPVVVSDMQEMAAFVSANGIGEAFRRGDAEHLASILDHLLSNPDRLVAYRAAVRVAGRLHSAGVEQDKLAGLYSTLL